MFRRIAAAAAVAATFAVPLSAQSLQQVCQSIKQLKVGQWAEWNMSTGKEQGTIRMSIVGTDQRDGKSYYWLEMSLTDPQRGKVIMQDLVPGYPFQPADIQGIVMKAPGQPAMRMPQQMLQMFRSRTPHTPGSDIAQNCNAAKVVGWESVTVSGGSFKALHLQDTSSTGPSAMSEVWVNPDVAFGLVKASSPQGSIELMASGADAKSEITETPQEMPMGGGN